MRLKNILITVNDMERAKRFYKELFGLEVILDRGSNVILTEGLVLQDRAFWEQAIGAQAIPKNNSALLYFEERDMDAFAYKLSQYQELPIKYLCQLTQESLGHAFIRFYDPDGNLIEVGSPWN